MFEHYFIFKEKSVLIKTVFCHFHWLILVISLKKESFLPVNHFVCSLRLKPTFMLLISLLLFFICRQTMSYLLVYLPLNCNRCGSAIKYVLFNVLMTARLNKWSEFGAWLPVPVILTLAGFPSKREANLVKV